MNQLKIVCSHVHDIELNTERDVLWVRPQEILKKAKSQRLLPTLYGPGPY